VKKKKEKEEAEAQTRQTGEDVSDSSVEPADGDIQNY
jgi:hypothetical protein